MYVLALSAEECSEFTDFGACSTSCGGIGYHSRSMWCVTFGVNGNNENVTTIEYEECFVPCETMPPTEPTTTQPTTTVLTSTTTGK